MEADESLRDLQCGNIVLMTASALLLLVFYFFFNIVPHVTCASGISEGARNDLRGDEALNQSLHLGLVMICISDDVKQVLIH